MTLAIAGNSAGGYNINKSLRFRSSATAYLSKSYAGGAGNTTTFTISMWVKRGQIGSSNTTQHLWNGGSVNTFVAFGQVSTDDISGNLRGTGGTNYFFGTSAVFRDPAAWYHIVFAVDTTQATASNRMKLYVNGVLQTLSTANYPPQNQVLLDTSTRTIGSTGGTYWFDGYLAEFNYVDGQQLTASSFGSTNSITGVWQPAKYTGSYGTTGFYLPFTNTTSTTTLGYDFSGNSNNWTTNNISLTAGTTYDSMNDVPTLTSTTVNNYAVVNPLNYVNGAAPTNGNLKFVDAGAGVETRNSSTIAVSSNKWYWESTVGGASINIQVGAHKTTTLLSSNTGVYTYASDGQKRVDSTYSAYGSAYAPGDVIGVAFDLTNGKIWFSKNGTWQASGDPVAGTNAAFTGISGEYFSFWTTYNVGGASSSTVEANFGQRPFAYTPPTGFSALNTYNLTDSTILAGNKVMDATLYTGTGAIQTVTNAASFKPDLVWIKSRSTVTNNELANSISGVQKYLRSNTTDAEISDVNSLQSFNSNGFSVGVDGDINGSGRTMVGWQWQAGKGVTSSNTSGSITSTVSVNPTAGFSIVTYTGTGANATVGHGLGVAPKLVIVKQRSGTGNWLTWHTNMPNTDYIWLNSDAASATAATVWNSTTPTSSVFSIGTSANINTSAATYVAYCWAPIAGFSAFGGYTGNGAADGPFVYTGFRPKYIMVKALPAITNWVVYDTARNAYNASTNVLYPNSTSAEITTNFDIDILSNGFKLRTTNGNSNNSGSAFIYAAFAENPFKNALAR